MMHLNIVNYPYVRGIHYIKDISQFKRQDKSYIELTDFDLGTF